MYSPKSYKILNEEIKLIFGQGCNVYNNVGSGTSTKRSVCLVFGLGKTVKIAGAWGCSKSNVHPPLMGWGRPEPLLCELNLLGRPCGAGWVNKEFAQSWTMVIRMLLQLENPWHKTDSQNQSIIYRKTVPEEISRKWTWASQLPSRWASHQEVVPLTPKENIKREKL